MEPIHIGQLIEQRRKQTGITKAELASRMNTSYQNIHGIITSRKSIQADMLLKFCHALNFDFFQYYTMVKNEDLKKEMQAVIDSQKQKIDELQKQADERNNSKISELDQKLNEALKIIEEKNFIIDVLRGKK